MKYFKPSSNYVTQKIMAYSAEESSPVEYFESCCICEEEFSSDSELTNHLLEHANEEEFKSSLKKFEQKNSIPERRKSANFMGQPIKRSFSQRSKSPEIVELLSDESDDESSKNKKQVAPPITKQAAPPITKQVAPSITKQVAPLISKQVAPPNSKQVVPTITKQVATPITKQVAAPITKQVAAPITKQVAPPITKQVATPITKQAASPITSNQAKSAATTNAPKPTQNPQSPAQSTPNLKAAQLGIYNCTQCSLVFKDIKLYKEHVATHDKARPYACQICNKKFAYKGTLRQHLHLHIGEKSHECKVCHKKFSLKRMLRQHEETHELEQRQGLVISKV